MLAVSKFQKIINTTIIYLIPSLLIIPLSALAGNAAPVDVEKLIDKVSEVNLTYEVEGQELLHEALLKDAEAYRDQNKDQAEAWVLVAVAKASYARTQGMSALGLMKKVRKELEQAMELDNKVMGGYAHSFLGRLYFSLPAWPISYGSDKKAKKNLEEALFIDSESKENNYSYAQFLLHKGKHEMAQRYLDKAKQLKPIFSSENWVKNMDKQIEEVQQQLDKELKEG